MVEEQKEVVLYGFYLVHTEDKDSGENARVRYSVDNDNFTINDQGEVSAKVCAVAESHKIGSASSAPYIFLQFIRSESAGCRPVQGALLHLSLQRYCDGLRESTA